MKKFFGEFKTFITRGNVLDMSVGVIVGGAFTAIVNGLSNFVLKPIINWLLALLFGSNSLDGIYTYLKRATVKTIDPVTNETVKTLDLANSIYIDWGAFINAIINFLLIAIVLFSIVKFFNRVRENNAKFRSELKKIHLSYDEIKELKENGVNIRNKEEVKAYFAKKEAQAAAKAEEEKRLAEEQAKIDRLNNPTTEDLLKDIKALLEKQINN